MLIRANQYISNSDEWCGIVFINRVSGSNNNKTFFFFLSTMGGSTHVQARAVAQALVILFYFFVFLGFV
jgi:hypothetical protein